MNNSNPTPTPTQTKPPPFVRRLETATCLDIIRACAIEKERPCFIPYKLFETAVGEFVTGNYSPLQSARRIYEREAGENIRCVPGQGIEILADLGSLALMEKESCGIRNKARKVRKISTRTSLNALPPEKRARYLTLQGYVALTELAGQEKKLSQVETRIGTRVKALNAGEMLEALRQIKE